MWTRKYKHFIWSVVPCQTLDTVGTLFHACPSHVIQKNKLQDTVGTWEQEKSNTLSQNKESIHALNDNIAFEN